MNQESSLFYQDLDIISNDQVAPGYYEMTLLSPEIAGTAKPGQFVTLLCEIKVGKHSYGPILRRPFSFHTISENAFSILYKVVGPGTEIMHEKDPGDEINVLGPLGNGFSLDGYDKLLFVAGGTGVSPLYALASEAKNQKKNITALIGAKTKDLILCKDFPANQVMVSTDDGTYGYNCYVTDLMKTALEAEQFDQIYVAGPREMEARAKEIAKEHDTPGQVTTEETIACGIGACYGCAIPIRADNELGFTYKKVCKDGPVFKLDEVIFR